jgi:hypothetical protein
MSRGKPSRKAFDAAVAAAKARGQVIFLRTYPGSACDFLIVTPYGIVAVCVRRTRRVQADIAEIAMAHNETLNGIRAADHCPGVSCEFWLWSPYGTMRFFLVEGPGLIELSPHGLPLVPPVTGRFAGQPANCTGSSENIPDNAPAGLRSFPGNTPAALPAAPAPGKPAVRDPPYLRFLRRRNAEIQRRKEEESLATGRGTAAGASPLPPQARDDVSPT